MRRKAALITSAFLLGALYAGPTPDPEPASPKEPLVSSRTLPVPLGKPVANPLPVGEKFIFVLKYEFIAAGTATLESNQGQPVGGRPTIALQSNAESNDFIDVFFKVRDFNSSTVDQETLTSYSFHQNLREGHYRVIRNTTMNYETGTYEYVRTYKGKTTERKGEFDQPASDILSSFFYARSLPLKLGEVYHIDVFSDGEIYPLRVEVDDEYDTVKVPAGKFECFRLRPQVVGDAIFKAKDGKMTIWVTKDEKHMPVQIRSKVFIGAFDAELSEYSRL